MNKKDIKKLLEEIEKPGLHSDNVEIQKLISISQKIKAARTQILPDENFKVQLGDKLYNKYLAQRKEKNMQAIEQHNRKTTWWKNWKVMAPAALALIIAIFASVWLIGKPNQDSEIQVAQGASALLSFKQGTVEYQDGDSSWEMVETNMVLKEGMKVRTSGNAKTVIDFTDGSIVRVDENSEIELDTLADTKVVLNQLEGNSYHRVIKGTSYKVMAGDSIVSAKGTAFGVEGTKDISVPVLDSSVSVELKNDNTVVTSKTVSSGKEGIVDTSNEKIDINDLGEEKLAEDWYKWNVEKDKDKDYSVYEQKSTEGPMLKVTEPSSGTEVKDPNITLKGITDPEAEVTVDGEKVDNTDGSFEKSLTLSEGDNVIKVKAVDKDDNETLQEVKIKYTKEDDEEEQDEEEEQPANSLSLSASAQSDGVHLSWVKFDGELTYYKVVRSETNSNLKYPDDGYIKVISDINTTSMVDTGAKSGKTYYYRICAVNTAKDVICGNVVQATAQGSEEASGQTSVSVSAQATESGVNIFFDATGDAPKGFKILISESPNPTYPGATYAQYVSADTRSYTWSGLPQKTLHVRVGAYDGSSVYAYSNDVTVTPVDQNDPPTASSISAQVKTDGVYLSWTKNNDSDFIYYKVVRSETNPAPTYPADGYIKAASREELSYVDAQVKSSSTGTYYYSVCTVDQAKQVTRSNVIKLVNGVIQ